MPTGEETAAEDPAETTDRASLTRALHELESAQRRVQKNAQRIYDEKRCELIVELLPVLDNLDRTIDAAKAASEPVLIAGVRMVRAQLESLLVRYGVERVDAAGQRFDPALHEAVVATPVLEPNLVGAVLRQVAPGYRFGDRVLRAARVSVGVPSRKAT